MLQKAPACNKDKDLTFYTMKIETVKTIAILLKNTDLGIIISCYVVSVLRFYYLIDQNCNQNHCAIKGCGLGLG